MRKKGIFQRLTAAALAAAMTLGTGDLSALVKAAEPVAGIGDVKYETLTDAINASKSGDEIDLYQDIQEAVQVTTGNKSIVVDLNNHTIDTTNAEKPTGDAFPIGRASTSADLNMVLKNGTIKDTNDKSKEVYGIYVYNTCNNVDLTLENMTIDTGDQALGVQGLNSNQNVTVKNSVIRSQTTAVYYPPKSGTMKIIDSEIASPDNGIVLKGGTLEVSGSKTLISSNGKAGTQDGPYLGDPTKPETFPKTGNAIQMEDAYTDRDIVLNISGGTIISQNNQAVLLQKFKESSCKREVNLTGGTYSSSVAHFLGDAYKEVKADTRYTVGTKAQSVTLDTVNAALAVGTEKTLKATVAPAGTPGRVMWTSDNETVASVDSDGKITAKAAGTAKITVAMDGKEAVCSVSVYEVEEPKAPTVDTSKPAETVTAGTNQAAVETVVQETEKIVADVVQGKDTGVADVTKQAIETAVKDGKTIKTEIVAEPVKVDDVKADAEKVTASIGTDAKVAQYLNLEVVLKVEDKEIGNITALAKPITFTVAIPAELQKQGRVFTIVRVHDGKAEKLDTKNSGNAVTFSTDKFSTYALTYKDPVVKPQQPITPAKPVVKKVPSYKLSSTRKIKVSWWRKLSADGFVIYAKAGNGKYKRVATVGRQSAKTVTVKSGYSYKFKVKAFKYVKKDGKKVRKYWKAYRAESKNGTKTVKITYKNISGYQGYVVYMKVGKGSYKRVKTTTKGGTITYTKTKAKIGKSHTFRLRGYKTVGGRKVYRTIKVKRA